MIRKKYKIWYVEQILLNMFGILRWEVFDFGVHINLLFGLVEFVAWFKQPAEKEYKSPAKKINIQVMILSTTWLRITKYYVLLMVCVMVLCCRQVQGWNPLQRKKKHRLCKVNETIQGRWTIWNLNFTTNTRFWRQSMSLEFMTILDMILKTVKIS